MNGLEAISERNGYLWSFVAFEPKQGDHWTVEYRFFPATVTFLVMA